MDCLRVSLEESVLKTLTRTFWGNCVTVIETGKIGRFSRDKSLPFPHSFEF